MKHSSLLRLSLALVCLAVFLTACSRDPNVRKQKYYESGQRYFAAGKYREAVIQFRNATEVDATFADAHYQLAQTYTKLQDWSKVYYELGRTIDLQPDNYKAQADIANLLIAYGQPDQLKEAQEHVDLLLQKQPNNPDTHIAYANLLSKQGKQDQALAEMQKAISLAPDRGDAYIDLAVLQTQANLPDAAEASYKKAVELNASGANPRLALAAFYQSRSRYAEAEQLVKQVIANDPKDMDSRAALVKIYLSEGKRPEAESFLKQVKQDFPNDPAGYRMLGDYYFEIQDLDKAVAEYESLYKDHSKDLQVDKNYIQLLILKGRLDDANKLNESLLKSRPKDDECLAYRGEIQLQQGKAKDAVQTLQAVTSSSPGLAVGHYQLGLALAQAGNIDRAAAEWHQAVHISPDMLDAYILLARYDMQKNDMAGLEEVATKIIGLRPTAPDGYAERALSLMQRKQFAAAEEDARKAIEVAPQSSSGYMQMGNLKKLQLQFGQAESWYRQALTREPNSADVLGALMSVFLLQKQPDKAIAVANEAIASQPDNGAFHGLLGTVLLGQKNYAAAQAELKKAVDLNKHDTDAYVKLAQAQYRADAIDAAMTTSTDGIRDNPNEYRFYLLMGSVYEKRNDLNNAKVVYQKALDLKPDDAPASNNLAYILLETNSNPDLALQLAQTARREDPEQPTFADTLGWALYQKGVYDSAINMFKEAIRLNEKYKQPDNPTYHYHLGLAYARASQPGLAKEHLERVLKINPNYTDAADVKKELAQLKS
ncbi:MAG TPA: tetratricopeptide repeat protein [Candidatus Binataceae bacterium]|nr:tetratricopeptide repeat protein [Candidatus Binataceae bacterium]